MSVTSYVTTRLGFIGRANEAWNLYRRHTRDIPAKVSDLLDQARTTEAKLAALRNGPVTNLRILEIGPGQQLVQLAYFTMRNETVGIDLDVILQRLTMRGFYGMAKKNGLIRTSKTVARKLARIDHHVRDEIRRQLGVGEIPRLEVLQMDAGGMQFPNDNFDIVVSRAVFEHLADPARVLREVRRVLRPGGVMLLYLHLYTSDSGCHDARILANDRGDLPFWPHLQREHEHSVRQNSYLNRLRLLQWRAVFEEELPGCEVTALQDASTTERAQLQALRSKGKLSDYSDEELLTVTLEAHWRKHTT